MLSVNTSELRELILTIGQVLENNKDLLTDLDRVIGDADHGINMARGFQAVREKLSGMDERDAGNLLKVVGMTLVSTVGGASGPLYGTAFLRAGVAADGKEILTGEDLSMLLGAAFEGIKQRGKAQRGDKTMVDALEPAYLALRDEIAAGTGTGEALKKSVAQAWAGVEYTKGIIAKKGRASYLGERSIGHQDPGATSSYLILRTIMEFVLARDVPRNVTGTGNF